MKLKIQQDNKNLCTSVSLDGVEIGNILRGLQLQSIPGRPADVRLEMFLGDIDVEVDANVMIEVKGNNYCLKSIGGT